MKHLHIALWGVLPYLVLTVLVAGTAWRYRYDRFGFTTRSSQLHEHRLLSVGGPLFHYGLLFVAAWHAIGLLVPESLTERVHVHEWLYHANALVVGGTAGLATLAAWRSCCTGGCACPPSEPQRPRGVPAPGPCPARRTHRDRDGIATGLLRLPARRLGVVPLAVGPRSELPAM